MSDRLTVWVPSYSHKNPYHDLLISALNHHDVEAVQLDTPAFLPLTRNVRRNPTIDVIHFDWLYEFFHARNHTGIKFVDTILTVGRTFWFIVDLLLVKLMGVGLIWTVHNKYHHEAYYRRLEWGLNIVVANIVHVVTVKCESASHTIDEKYRIRDLSKIHIVPDGTYAGYYPDSVSEDEARAILEIGDNEFVFLYFGLIKPYKGIDDLIAAFKRLNSDHDRLLIVGNPNSGEIRGQLASMAADDQRIDYHFEFIPTDEVQYYLNAADVLVLPYTDILNSGSVYLGLTYSTPIIAPELGCIPEVLQHQEELLYTPNDRTALFETLSLSKEIDLAPIILQNEAASQEFEWEDIATDYIGIYDEIIS